MNKLQFEALLPFIITNLMKKIIDRKKLSESEAFLQLYNSGLYSFLDDEETKVWHYSTEMLFSLFEEEIKTGKLELPEY